MRVTKDLLLAVVMVVMTALCCSFGNAQIIYSNDFTGGTATSIFGVAPTVANTFAGGSSGALWNLATNNAVAGVSADQNGTLGKGQNTVLLPFTAQPGYIYTLSGSITFTADPANWISMGFAAIDPPVNTSTGGYRFNDSGVNGNPWSLFRPGTGNGGVQLYYNRTSAVGSQALIPTTFPSTNTISMVLDTSGAKWVVSESVNGTPVTTNYSYNGNPTITAVGYGQTSLGAGGDYQWNYLTLSAVSVPMTNSIYNTCWVAPAATGKGDGSSSADAASFLDYGFWNGVQSLLQVTNVTVNLNDGAYFQGMLSFTNMGNSLHRLTLQAVNPYKPVFSANLGTLVSITGSQNIKFSGLVFTGPAQYWGVYCIPNGINPCRNLEFSGCQFTNLTGVMYAALGLLNGTRSILVDNCGFANLTANNGNHQHMIYASHDIVDVLVTNCSLQDCYADYIRFRDDSEYCTVENCAFISTTSASVWPFISSELFQVTNSDSAGDEFFGNNFQITSNSFNYNASGGTGPRAALHFSDDGYSPNSYNCAITSSQAGLLAGGTTSFQQSFLQTNFGITASGIKMFGNTYNSRVNYAVDYTYVWDGIQPDGGSQGPINLSGVPDSSGALLGPASVLRNGNFDRQGLLLTPISTGLKNNECLFRGWFCSPQYTPILWHAGFNGTSNALMFNKTANQCVYQWITPPGPAWTMDFLFAMDSGFTGSGVKFKVDIFHDDVSGGKFSVGVNDQGQFGVFNYAIFTPLSALGTVSISANNVYRMRIVGNYAASTPSVNIYTSDANNPALTHQSLGLNSWIGGPPVSGQSSPETIAFYNYANTVIVDQVALGAGLAEQPPVITKALFGNGQFVLAGTNGFAGDTYYVLSSTNLALLPSSWTMAATNTFDGTGSFTITNVMSANAAQLFYRLQLQ